MFWSFYALVLSSKFVRENKYTFYFHVRRDLNINNTTSYNYALIREDSGNISYLCMNLMPITLYLDKETVSYYGFF